MLYKHITHEICHIAGVSARHINVLIRKMHNAATINIRILGEDKLHFLVSLHLSLFIYIFVASFCSVNFIDIVLQTHQLMKSEKIAFSLSFFLFVPFIQFLFFAAATFSLDTSNSNRVLNCCTNPCSIVVIYLLS